MEIDRMLTVDLGLCDSLVEILEIERLDMTEDPHSLDAPDHMLVHLDPLLFSSNPDIVETGLLEKPQSIDCGKL